MQRTMKTKTLIISALFTLSLGTCFSQVNTDYDSELNEERDALTAMNLAIEKASKIDFESTNTAARITSFPEFISSPEYTNVNEYIHSNMEFPEEAREIGLSGLVKVRFDINKDGSIGNVDFLESPDISFNEEVLRLLDKMPNWKPALSANSTVVSRYQLNINFSLH